MRESSITTFSFNDISDSNFKTPVLKLLRDLAIGNLGFLQLVEVLKENSELTFLTLDTTGICDLKCQKMCYYHPAINAKKNASEDKFFNAAILEACQKLDLKILIFSGKEPLLNIYRLHRLISFAGNLSGQYNFDIGIVTNGRLIAKNWQWLNSIVQKGWLHFLDISIDSGIPEQHDSIRGVTGTFLRAYSSLERCKIDWPQVRVGCTSVLRHDNGDGILALITRSASFNEYYFITPIQPPPFSDIEPLSWNEIRKFIEALISQLETEQKEAGLEIIIQLLGLYLYDAQLDGFFDWNELQEDAVGQIFTERDIGGNRLILQMQVLPDTSWRTARITYDGFYLPNAHFLQHPQPESFAVGNIQEESIVSLYRRSLSETSTLYKILQSRNEHSCRKRPCWGSCFGGLAASENIFITGGTLTEQPQLCLKTNNDF